MSKNMKRLAWLVSNAAVIYCLYLWLAKDSLYASRLTQIYIWFHLIVSFIGASNDDIIQKIQEKGPSVPVGINYAGDWGISLALIAYGHWVYGIVYLAGALLQTYALEVDLSIGKRG